MPSNLKVAKAKASKAPRQGLYSTPAFLTSIRAPEPSVHTELQKRIGGGSSDQHSDEDFRASLENEAVSLDHFALELNDPSGLAKDQALSDVES
jgi:hypothetical protein